MPARPLLFLGSKDPAVATVVAKLRAHGFWDDPKTPKRFTRTLERQVEYFQRTHLGPTGKFLDVDGIVGPDTWWALFHASGKAQTSNLKPKIPAGLGPLRTRILEVALAEHAKPVVERPNGSNRGPEVDKYLPAWAKKGKSKGPAWCCFFYSWVVKEALGTWPLGRQEGSCMKARERAGALELWIPKGLSEEARPFPGDAFVMDKGSGKGHIGFVLRVSADGSEINTVEGNCGNRVKVGLRELADPQIVGFIDNCPDEPAPDFARGIVKAPRVGRLATR